MKWSILLFMFVLMFSCCERISILWGAGTHGTIASYSYEISKDSLELIMNSVIEDNNSLLKLETDGGEGTYIKMSIDNNQFIENIVFRFSGNEDYWKKHPNESHISITAAKRGNEEYKSEGNMSRSERRLAISLFEDFFIMKLEKQKGLRPVSCVRCYYLK